jgi:predicted PurR-regulated permease PerM
MTETSKPQRATPSLVVLRILAGLALLGLLYLGSSVLAPIVLAVTLAFVLAPIVRQIRRLGLGQAAAAMSTLVLVGVTAAGIALAIVAQLSAMTQDLPRYEANVRDKISTLRVLTVDRMRDVQSRAGRLFDERAQSTFTSTPPETGSDRADRPSALRAIAQYGHTPEDDSSALGKFLGAVWGPLGVVGVVVLVLVFALVEQNSLRDRLIRLTGGRDVRAATSAVNDAGQRLSRYFVSQFSVNFGAGLVIWVLLTVLSVPHATVWALLASLLRFVPYVGFPTAALLACAMAAAMAPGWGLVASTAFVFLGVELVAAYAVEPLLYGHTTGLSPFSVVVGAIFWGALWGPVGLLLSTPLTLCLVVAGRHVPELAFLDILLGDAAALDLSQRFYQRCLSGDAVEVLADARVFLKRRSLAAYCDKVVMPAFELAREDIERSLITTAQQAAAHQAISQIFAELTHAPRTRRRRAAALDTDDLGLNLRQERQRAEGRWQGPLNVPPGSVVMCVSMPGGEPHLTAELLVRVLRNEQLDARHVTVQELAHPPADARFDAVGTVFVVGTTDGQVTGPDIDALNECLVRMPLAAVVLMLPMLSATRAPTNPIAADRVHRTAYSFDEAVALVRPAHR